MKHVRSINYKMEDIQAKIKNNEMKTFREFVRRLKLEQDPNASKEKLIHQLSTYLITDEGKTMASKILGREITVADQQQLVQESLAEMKG